MRFTRPVTLLGAVVLSLSSVAVGQDLVFGDTATAMKARSAILELDVVEGARVLEGTDTRNPDIAYEQARLAMYTGDCDRAAALLDREDLLGDDSSADMAVVARGCVRSVAGTTTVTDERGVVVRLQDDHDGVLVPLLVETALAARETLKEELGVELPLPIRIELVRDQFALAAMTGLPLDAARTTGTVAVAKWGRVTMLTPRAGHGYPYLDTLVHELTHLALARGTREKAPLWLQEGIAKREEHRWRAAGPFDESPPADHVAAMGLRRKIGPPIDAIGPSIAMLSSAEEATVTFAKVTSFMSYYIAHAGPSALPRLLEEMKAADDMGGVEAAMKKVTDKPFDVWAEEWRSHLLSIPEAELDTGPFGFGPDGVTATRDFREIARRNRVGELLAERGHYAEAAVELARAHAMAPQEAMLRCGLADALLHQSLTEEARPLVADVADIDAGYGRWWSLHGHLHPADAVHAFAQGVALNPFDPHVACQEKDSPQLVEDATQRALCETARALASADERR